MIRRPPRSTLLSLHDALPIWTCGPFCVRCWPNLRRERISTTPSRRDENGSPPSTRREGVVDILSDRKSTRLNSSHTVISYAVFCLKKKKKKKKTKIQKKNIKT